MNNQNKKEFAQLLTMVADVVDQPLNQATIGTYWNILNKYSIEQFRQGVQRLLQTHKYNKFPLPAVFIENIVGDLSVKALEGWNQYRRLVDRYGLYQNPEVTDDVLVHTIHKLGGWIAINEREHHMTDRDFTFFRTEFMNLYRALASEPNLGPVPRLVGLCEKQNVALGYQKPGESQVRGKTGRMIDLNQPPRKEITDGRD